MPGWATAGRELADLFGVVGNPDRRMAEELQIAAGISHSGVSQHLSLLCADRLAECRDGRGVFYHVPQTGPAVEGEIAQSEISSAVEQARRLRAGAEK